MCEFRGSNGNGFGDIWWTDKLFYFSSTSMLTKEVIFRVYFPVDECLGAPTP